VTKPRVVLAEYFVTDNTTLLFIVREDLTEPEVVEFPIGIGALRQFVTSHFGRSSQSEQNPGLDKAAYLDEVAYQETIGPLVEPIASWADEGDIVWLVPHDALHYLPLHALKVQGRYLIERNPVCYSPSASVMKYCHAKRKGSRQTALVLGDSRGNMAHALEEASTVAGLFGTTPYLRGQATKSLIKEKLATEHQSIDIIHIACHGKFNLQQPLQSHIQLAPEDATSNGEMGGEDASILTAEEIFGLEMNAELVTLSACETGISDRRPGDELIGLTRALIYAGTPSVIVGLWKVNSLSTQILMEHFYHEFKGGETKVVALQRAQLAVMGMTYGQTKAYVHQRRELARTSGAEDADVRVRDLDVGLFSIEVNAPDFVDDDWRPFATLYYWAPFVLIGDWL
jgi:CHAT domain-containing protein